jgi:histidinol-phosphate phosphatase family protein
MINSSESDKLNSETPLLRIFQNLSFDRSLGIVVFDRDGTLIKDCGQHNDPLQLEFLDGAFESLKLIKNIGFGLGLATNQAGLSNGKFSLDQLDSFHQEMQNQIFSSTGIRIDIIAICPHNKQSSCNCRKPRTGLLSAIEKATQSNVSLFVGDSSTDKESAMNYNVDFLHASENGFYREILSWSENL